MSFILSYCCASSIIHLDIRSGMYKLPSINNLDNLEFWDLNTSKIMEKRPCAIRVISMSCSEHSVLCSAAMFKRTTYVGKWQESWQRQLLEDSLEKIFPSHCLTSSLGESGRDGSSDSHR
jgi:hypothetical protein